MFPICCWKNCFGGRESKVLGVWFCISSSNCGSGEPSGNSQEPLPRRAASARSSAPSVCSAASLRAREGGEQTPRPPAPGTRRQSALACSAGTSLPVSATTAQQKKKTDKTEKSSWMRVWLSSAFLQTALFQTHVLLSLNLCPAAPAWL